ncbi:MAG: helix-turn-helix transcriptional regulator [Clostridia bacterium]|nr:helix-turn-helix transcriptional regulator [Clostridia bacterium]
MNIPLGENIRRLRQENDMTQRALAHHLRVSVQAVSKWETGLSYPDVALLLNIADFFAISLDALFGREERNL